MSTTTQYKPCSARDTNRLALLFSLIGLVFKATDTLTDQDHCQTLWFKLKDILNSCFLSLFSNEFGGGVSRYYYYTKFPKLSEEFEVIDSHIISGLFYFSIAMEKTIHIRLFTIQKI